AATDPLVAAGAGVGAEDQDVLRAVVGLLGPVGAERLVDVDTADVAVELEVDVPDTGAAQHHDARGGPGHHLHAGGPLAARLAAASPPPAGGRCAGLSRGGGVRCALGRHVLLSSRVRSDTPCARCQTWPV